MARSSVIPSLPKERLVMIRESFLKLCGGDHCAAALLNDFVYWHDWCVDRERQDTTAQAADPTHESAEPGYWFWKSNEDLENDLMHMWTAKTIRSAAKLLLQKQLIEERGNPRNPFDRTKQFRLLNERLSASLRQLDSPGAAPLPESPSRSGKITACRKQSTSTPPPAPTPVDSTNGKTAVSMRENYRIDAGKLPALPTEITNSENTESSSSPASCATEKTRKTTPESASANPQMPATVEVIAQGEENLTPPEMDEYVEAWAKERRVRRQRDDGQLSTPDAHSCALWASYCAERGIVNQADVYRVLDIAKHAADARDDWRRWKFLDVQVQLAAERFTPPAAAAVPPAEAEPVLPEDETTEWARIKQQLRPRISAISFDNWVAQTRQLARAGSVLRVAVSDECTAAWLRDEYGPLVADILPGFDIAQVEYTWMFNSVQSLQ